MSQWFLGVTEGNLPPSVATQYTADDATIAIPSSHNLNVFSRDTIANNDNGIQTTADPNLSNNLYVQLTNRIKVTATTSDGAGQTQTITLMTPANNSALEFSASIIGYDAINNEAAGGSQEGISRKSGGTTVIVGTNDSLDEADAGLVTVDWDVIASGADLAIRFVGVAGRTINWSALFSYTQVT